MPILDQFGKEIPAARPRPKSRPRIRASYDAAQTTDENRKHWQAADSYSANAANDPQTRQTLRDRSRYERANNSYCRGLVSTVGNDTIGTGPRLQLSIPDVPRATTRIIEKMYGQWARQINKAEKIRVMAETKIGDGESFGLQITNPTLDPFLPQLDLKLYEAEQVADPFMPVLDPNRTDGIVFDDWGNPLEYHLLKTHPGSEYGFLSQDYEPIPASRMLHNFRPDRPGQARGIPEIMPALPLFAQLRRYTLAVILAAEFGASLAGVLYSDQAPDYQGSDTQEGDDPAFDRVEWERGGLFTAPKGWKVEGFDSKQPMTAYEMFKAEILNEIGRALNVPFNVVAGNSSRYNYSSGRLDHLIYHRSINMERARLRARVLDPLFRAWLQEAYLMGLMPADLPPIAQWSWEWHWDGFASIDPQKEATARQTMLTAGLTTYAAEFAQDGLDWEEQFEQQSLEQKRRAELGLAPVTPPAPAAPSPADSFAETEEFANA